MTLADSRAELVHFGQSNVPRAGGLKPRQAERVAPSIKLSLS